MRKDGKVLRWDAERAFGFIRSPDTAADIFFHIKDFRGAGAPQQGMTVRFEEIHVGGKGPRAVNVQTEQVLSLAPKTGTAAHATRRQPSPRRTATGSASQRTPNDAAPSSAAAPVLLLMLAWAALIVWASWAGRLPVMAAPIALLLNLVTFFVYWVDKHAAQTGQWRTAENTLHLFSLVGGWPGAWCAQQVLRHKSKKASFRSAYWLTVALHCIVLTGILFSRRLQGLLLNI